MACIGSLYIAYHVSFYTILKICFSGKEVVVKLRSGSYVDMHVSFRKIYFKNLYKSACSCSYMFLIRSLSFEKIAIIEECLNMNCIVKVSICK